MSTTEHQLIKASERRDSRGRYIHIAVASIVAECSDENDALDMAGLTFYRPDGPTFTTRDEQLANRRGR